MDYCIYYFLQDSSMNLVVFQLLQLPRAGKVQMYTWIWYINLPVHLYNPKQFRNFVFRFITFCSILSLFVSYRHFMFPFCCSLFPFHYFLFPFYYYLLKATYLNILFATFCSVSLLFVSICIINFRFTTLCSVSLHFIHVAI